MTQKKNKPRATNRAPRATSFNIRPARLEDFEEIYDIFCNVLEEGETLHTENSYKYTVAEFQALAREAGFEPGSVWVDGDGFFAIHYLIARGADA